MRRISVLAIAVALGLVPQAVMAKLACYPLAQIERALDAEYGETRRFSGHESTGVEYRLYVNASTGSWSWVGVPAGTTVGCLIFAGTVQGAPPPAAPPAPGAPEAQF